MFVVTCIRLLIRKKTKTPENTAKESSPAVILAVPSLLLRLYLQRTTKDTYNIGRYVHVLK